MLIFEELRFAISLYATADISGQGTSLNSGRPTGQDHLFWLTAVAIESQFRQSSSAAVHLPGNGDSHAVKLATRCGIENVG
jgi:hypothetical protein